jgi:group I intron endonuclease
MYFGIYSITNVVTGDMYIGQTIQDFEKRWKSHISALNRGNHDNEYLQRSWNKYGEDAFKFKAIHYCDELDILNDLEKYYIKKYDTYNNGFNMTEGGDYFLNEIPEEIRKKRLENLKKVNRERSDYTEHQIAKVKEMLSVLENNPISIKKISKLTGVRENIIYSIKNLDSWIDVRSDLNEKIKQLNFIECRNKKIIEDLYSYNYSLEELCNKYNLAENSIRTIFYKEKIKDYGKVFKDVKNTRMKQKFLKGMEKGIETFIDMENFTGHSRYTLEKMCEREGLQEQCKKLRKIRNKNMYKSKEKGVNYDIKRKSWFLRINFNGKQIPIGRFKTEKDAIDAKQQLIPHIKTNDYTSILAIKAKYSKKVTPKKTIKAINIKDNSEEIIEGIGVCARKLDIPRKSIEKVLQGKQKTTYGYTFAYV